MSASQDEIPLPPPPPPSSPHTPTQQTPHTISTIKLPILKKGEYDIWAMKMDHLFGPYRLSNLGLYKMGMVLFIVSNSEGLHKGYDRFQSLLSQLEIHGAGVSTEDANQKFLRSLPSAWSQVSLIMRTKPGVDSLSFDDLYNNLRVFESDVKGSTASSSSPQNVAFISKNTSSTNEIDEYDLEEMDLKWQVAMISMRMKKFYKKTGYFARECRIKGNQDNRRRDAWNSRTKDGSRTGKKEDSKALVTIDGEGVDEIIISRRWKKKIEYYALRLAQLRLRHRGLKKVEAQLVAHQQGQLCANDKFGLGYGDHRYDGILSYENEVLQNVFMNKESELEKQPLYDRFVIADRMHVVPPPMTGNYMPSGPDIDVDYSQFTYGPKQTQPSESESQSSEFDTCESNISTEPSELVSEPVVNESNIECQHKVWSDAPIIEEYESDSEDEYVSILIKQQETPSFANQQVKTPRETDKNQFTHSQKPKVDKKELGYGFTLVLLGEKGKLLLSPQQVVIGDHKDTTGTKSPNTMVDPVLEIDYPYRALKNKGIVDNGCSRNMTGNKACLAEFQDFNGGPVAFGGSKGYITGKGKIKTGKLDFEDVCFVKELQHFNLFSVSQMCDKKNKVLFTDSECLVLSPEFKLPDENQVLLKIPRQNNMYSFNLENIVPSGGLACLIAKATTDESNKWHRRLGHVNFKNLNKLVKGNLVRGLPSKIFQNDHTCVACQKGKQHKASCKAKSVSSISHSLQLLHMDLFGPTSVRSLNHKTYCLVITDDVSRGLIGFRESLRRVIDGTDALLLPTLFILWLDTVSTDSAKLVPLGKVCTAIEMLKKNTAKALISLLTTITLSTTMVVLDSCPKHNMVAYLEKTEGNAEFHEIIDFLTRSSIHHALTVSPVVSTTFVEQFWTSAKSKIFNNVRHITAKVAGKPVSISEASIRSDLLFDDANGIDSLPNQAIFDAIQLMGSQKSTVTWDQIPTNIATAVICLTSNQKYNFSKLIFDVFRSSQRNTTLESSGITKLKKQAQPVRQTPQSMMQVSSLKHRLDKKRCPKKQSGAQRVGLQTGEVKYLYKVESFSPQEYPLFDESLKIHLIIWVTEMHKSGERQETMGVKRRRMMKNELVL
ncbi:putative ribonuclease H-like domain-containing protein [Tanacetum coccineum]|uniref:Ribonuclease H-like domain-containing protein n=1 Tax=Tanacetum coccineum TaxID=301880 RepID=A0ABQ5C403_9ASTR